MPPNATAIAMGALPLPTLARQIIHDKNAGVPGTEWVKYMNWTDENGVCRQERWMPDHETRSSTDKDHIHLSARSDMDTSDVVSRSGWNPVEGNMSAQFTNDLIEAMGNAAVIARWRTLSVTYAGGPLPEGVNFLSAVNKILLATTNTLPALVQKAITEASNDPAFPDVPPLTPEQIAAITQAVVDGVVAVVPSAEENADAVIAEIAS
jgi:hypothetical protein